MSSANPFAAKRRTRGSPVGHTNNPEGGGPGTTTIEACPLCGGDPTPNLPTHIERECGGV